MGAREDFRLKVYTGGTFDCFHVGHVNFLRQCAVLAGQRAAPSWEVTVSLNTDEFVKSYKGQPSVVDFEDRKKILEACRYVSRVVTNLGGPDSKPAIMQARPDIIAIGTDWVTRDYYEQMGFTQKWLDQRGIVLAYLPRLEGVSTTELRTKM
jgi:glycerol-3-phosphate cytidylyltransferase